ncbi:MAG TPA: CAP domain-containing protein, partial [Herpetosiphonaceae bacterium]|nr:CAP domain-containing protein [Herpetosiphonaceae bacterium]
MLELINAERAEAGSQPLAFNGDLNEAAEDHSQWMLATDIFSHTGQGGSTAGQRMAAAGYSFTGSWTRGENIGWGSLRSPSGYQDDVEARHTSLMNSTGHRANILSDGFEEIGIGFEVGSFKGYQSSIVTQNFARSGTGSFVTGVAFDDQDGDRFYDPGEGLGGLSVSISGSSGTYTTTTMASGGYQQKLAAGTYTVTFSGEGIATSTHQVTVGSKNVKLDLVDPAAGGGEPAPSDPDPVEGTSVMKSLIADVSVTNTDNEAGYARIGLTVPVNLDAQ